MSWAKRGEKDLGTPDFYEEKTRQNPITNKGPAEKPKQEAILNGRRG